MIQIQFVGFNAGDWLYSSYDEFHQQEKIVCPNDNRLELEWHDNTQFCLLTIPSEGYYPVYPGDSIVLTRNNNSEHPDVAIPNGNFTHFEINFPALLSASGCSILEYYVKNIVSNQKSHRCSTTKDSYKRSLQLLDSCRSAGLIGDIYSAWIQPHLTYSFYKALLLENPNSVDLSSVDLTNDSLLGNYSYRSFLQHYLIYKLSKSDYDKVDYRKAFMLVDSAFDGGTRDYLLFYCTINIMEKFPGEESEWLKKFDNASQSTVFKSYMTRNFGQNETGENADDFLIGADNVEVRMEDFIRRLRGKIIYIDLWASWCGPCRAEMPASEELRKALAGDCVAFLYLSIDTKPDTWLKASRQERLSIGENSFRFKAGDQAQILNTYKITSIPRYIILDRTCKVIDANATRPGDPETLKQLSKLCR